MILNWVNIKHTFPNGRVGFGRCNKSTLSNRVNFIMRMGYSFEESLKKAKSKEWIKMVVISKNK